MSRYANTPFMMLSAAWSEIWSTPARLPMQPQGWCQSRDQSPRRYTRKPVEIHATASKLKRLRPMSRQEGAD